MSNDAAVAGLTEIGAVLKTAIGLDVGLIGVAALENAVKRRLVARRIADASLYLPLLWDSEVELQALIDEVIVPETWFFRDREAFTALVALLPLPEGRNLRLLSLPCATGEEPYSIAIALLAAGIPPERFRIEGLDVSVAVLAKAERAIYGRNSFRGIDIAFRDHYFELTEAGYYPADIVRRQVHFAKANLLDPFLLADAAPYDAIFCRNVLIYFDRATQERVLHRLRQHIAPDGLLFLGPSEQNLGASCGFTSVRIAHSFAFRVTDMVPLPQTKLKADRPVTPRRLPPSPPRPPSIQPQARPSAPIAPTVPAPPVADPLDRARQLADLGNFIEAGEACDAALKQHGASAEIYYLSGLVHDAAADTAEAIKLYRKALYLDPNHRDTLQHLSLILHQRRSPSAQMLDARLSRLRQHDAGKEGSRR